MERDDYLYRSRTIILEEHVLKKIQNTLDKASDLPADVILKPMEIATKNTIDTPGVNKLMSISNNFKRNILTDPTKQDTKTNAKEWALGMGAGSLLMHSPDIISGNIAVPLGTAAINTIKGATVGAALTGGKDTLLKSTLVPAGTMALSTPVLNAAGDFLGLGHEIDSSPEQRVATSALIGGGLWALRNRGKGHKKQWV